MAVVVVAVLAGLTLCCAMAAAPEIAHANAASVHLSATCTLDANHHAQQHAEATPAQPPPSAPTFAADDAVTPSPSADRQATPHSRGCLAGRGLATGQDVLLHLSVSRT